MTHGARGRIARGDAVVAAAASLSAGAVAKRFAAFAEAHARYAAADAELDAAATALAAQEAVVGRADAVQDVEVDAVAAALATDGFPRINPFRPLGFVSPADLKKLGFAAEAEEVMRLVDAIGRHPRASKASKLAAARLGAAARDLRHAVGAIAKLTKARSEALARRDARAQPWETAHAALELAAASADLDGHRVAVLQLFAAGKPAATAATVQASSRPRSSRRAGHP